MKYIYFVNRCPFQYHLTNVRLAIDCPAQNKTISEPLYTISCFGGCAINFGLGLISSLTRIKIDNNDQGPVV